MKLLIWTMVVFALFQNCMMLPHGFVGNTTIALERDQDFTQIQYIVLKFLSGQTTQVCSYQEKSQTWKLKSVQSVAHCESDGFFELHFISKNAVDLDVVCCSPLQLFYRFSDRSWVAAHDLSEGDLFLCKNNEVTSLQSKKYVQQTTKLYIIEVKKYHKFLVGRQKILTHNMFIPIATTIGMAIPFDIVCGAGAFGCMFGPVTFCCSIVAGGVAAAIAYQYGKEKHTEFSLVCDDAHGWDFTVQYNDKDKGISDAQAPGMPTEHDGFIPKKNWDGKKIKNPNGRGYGWPDKGGSVWIPTGPNGHGGPHWDVQHPNGDYDNILPGGKIRGQK